MKGLENDLRGLFGDILPGVLENSKKLMDQMDRALPKIQSYKANMTEEQREMFDKKEQELKDLKKQLKDAGIHNK